MELVRSGYWQQAKKPGCTVSDADRDSEGGTARSSQCWGRHLCGGGAHSGRNEQTCWERRRQGGPVVQSFVDGGIAGCNPELGSNLQPALFRLGCWTECPVLGIGGALKLRVLQMCARQTQDGRQSTDLSHVTTSASAHTAVRRRKGVGVGVGVGVGAKNRKTEGVWVGRWGCGQGVQWSSENDHTPRNVLFTCCLVNR